MSRTHQEAVGVSQPPADPASRAGSLFIAAAGAALTLAVILYPEHAFEASLAGLELWLEIVLPALLPFFALAEILMGLGVIHWFGVLLEPLMRPLFRIPGAGAFAVAIGLASGYPLGAKISGDLRRRNLCTKEEGERLVAFSNTADPLFMVGAVAVGMFGDAAFGTTLASAHYLAVITVGLLMRFHAGGRMGTAVSLPKGGLLHRATDALFTARAKDGRPPGELFSDAIKSAISSLLFVGGCIMMFSVFIRLADVSGLIGTIGAATGSALSLLGMDPAVGVPLAQGFVEITIGTQAASQADAPIAARLVAASAIIAWSGFSVHAQVAAMVHGTDIRLRPYLKARALHAVLAALYTIPLHQPVAATLAGTGALTVWHGLSYPGRIATGALVALGILLAASGIAIVMHILRKVRLIILRV